MSLLALYVVTLVIFLAVDAVWLGLVMKPLFDSHIGHLMRERPMIGAALGFYVLYVAGLVWLAGRPGLAGAPLSGIAVDAAIIGFMAYGTYEATSMAIMKDWSWKMVIVDTLWGTALTAGSIVAGVAIVRAFA